MSLTPFSFVDGALDRADHLRDDPDALAARWPQAGVIVLDADGRAFAGEGKALRVMRGAELDGGAFRRACCYTSKRYSTGTSGIAIAACAERRSNSVAPLGLASAPHARASITRAPTRR